MPIGAAKTRMAQGDGGTPPVPPSPFPLFKSLANVNGAGAQATSMTIPTPAGTVQGDFLMALMTTNGLADFDTPAGWTMLRNYDVNTITTTCLYKFAGASEPTDHTFTWDQTDEYVGLIVNYKDVNATTPITVYEVNARNLKNMRCLTMTTPLDNCTGVFYGGLAKTATCTLGTAGPTFRLSHTDGVEVTGALSDWVIPTATATGNVNYEHGQGRTRFAALSIALNPV